MNAELDYVVLSGSKDGANVELVVAELLADSVAERAGLEGAATSSSFKGAVLENLQLSHPFLEREVPTILGDRS